MPPSCALLGGFAIGARVALLRQHKKCVAEPSGNPPGPPHALRTHAPAIKSSACCVRDVICNEAVPFRLYCGDVVTRTRNVSEYMLVLAVCLVVPSVPSVNYNGHRNVKITEKITATVITTEKISS